MAADRMTERYSGLDLYRIIACAFVIVNHCNSKVMIQVTPKSLAWYVTVGVIFITKVCVPGFFMIMGFNLLHRKEDFKTYITRIKRIAVVLTAFGAFYYIWRCIVHSVYIDLPPDGGILDSIAAYIAGFVRVLFRDGATDAFWYLYTYLGLLILMPVFQLAAAGFTDRSDDDEGNGHKIDRRHLVTIIALGFVYISVIPSVTILDPGFRVTSDLVIPMALPSVMYLFIGHVCYLYRDRLGAGRGIGLSDCVLAALYVIAFAANMILAIMEYTVSGGTAYVSYSEIYTAGMVVQSVCTFILFLKIQAAGRLKNLTACISPLTFGVYLFADFMCSNTHLIYYYLCQYMNRLAAVAIQDMAAYALALAATWLIRLIPAVRRYV